MSFYGAINEDNSNGLKDRLEGNSKQEIEDHYTSIQSYMEALSKTVIELEGFVPKIGTPEDSKKFRAKIRDVINLSSAQVMDTKQLITEFEVFRPKKKEIQEKQKKLLGSANSSLMVWKGRLADAVRKLTHREREHLAQAKQSVMAKKSTMFKSRFDSSSVMDSDVSGLEEVNVEEAMVKEYQEDVENIEKTVNALHGIITESAERVEATGEALDVITDNINEVKENVTQTNEDLESQTDRPDYIAEENAGQR